MRQAIVAIILLANVCSAAGKDTIVLQDTVKKPSVVLQDSLLDPMIILTIRDTAAGQADINRLFSKDYGELFTYIGQNGLRPGKVLAQYYSVRPVFIFDAAVEIDRLPATTKGRVKIDRIKGGSVVIAHFKGPYDKIGMAYNALRHWLDQHYKKADGQPFEVYLDDPATVQDPFELRTDVYQLVLDIPHPFH